MSFKLQSTDAPTQNTALVRKITLMRQHISLVHQHITVAPLDEGLSTYGFMTSSPIHGK